MNGYPVVFVNDWCGDHRLNENWAPPASSTAELFQRFASSSREDRDQSVLMTTEVDRPREERDQLRNACENLSRENEMLGKGLDRMTDHAAGLACIKPETANANA